MQLPNSTFIAAWAAFVLIVYPVSITYASSNNSNTDVFTPESKPYKRTYGEWAADWWKWYASIPSESNPGNDQTGKNCAIGQKDSNVWFLAGTGGGSAKRSCSIPAGKAILFPIINMECSYATDPAAKTEPEMRACAMSGDEGATVQASIDGKQLQNLEKFRIQSPLFNVTLPENNVFGVKAGFTPMISDGWWVLLKPLPPGNHEIRFGGAVPDNPTTGTRGFATEMSYTLAVNT